MALFAFFNFKAHPQNLLYHIKYLTPLFAHASGASGKAQLEGTAVM